MQTKVACFLFLALLTVMLVMPAANKAGKAVPVARESGVILASPKPGDAG